MEGFNASSLTREQVLKAFLKYEPLMQNSTEIEIHQNENYFLQSLPNINDEVESEINDSVIQIFNQKYDTLWSDTLENQHGELVFKIQQLESSLETEKLLKRVLDQKYAEKISELNKTKLDFQNIKDEAENWSSMYNDSFAELQHVESRLESATSLYLQKISEMDKELQESKDKNKLLLGDEEELSKLDIFEIHNLEKKLLDNLSKIQTIKENKLLEKLRTKNEGPFCVICKERNINIILCPCNHVCLCHECSGNILTCPLCRTNITSKQKVFISK